MMETKSEKKARVKLQKLCEGDAPGRRIRRAISRLRQRISVSAGRSGQADVATAKEQPDELPACSLGQELDKEWLEETRHVIYPDLKDK